MLSALRSFRFAGTVPAQESQFTAATLLTLALSLGANLTIFAVINSILLRPLPFPQSDRLVTTLNSYPLAGSRTLEASFPNYYDYREKIKAFASTAIISDASGHAIVGAAGSPYRVECDRVSLNSFKPSASRSCWAVRSATPKWTMPAAEWPSSPTRFGAAISTPIPKSSAAPFRWMDPPPPSSAYFHPAFVFFLATRSLLSGGIRSHRAGRRSTP